MAYTFDTLRGEYEALLARMALTRAAAVDKSAEKLLRHIAAGRYDEACAKTGVPKLFAAATFEREASSNFKLSPAQGDRWDRVSVHVPRGRGPFTSWAEAACDAYRLARLDRVGAANWTWVRACYEGERFNGFGYRARGMHSPYLWAGTNHYACGKFTADGRWDPSAVDKQLGIVPLMRRMAELNPALRLLEAATTPGA